MNEPKALAVIKKIKSSQGIGEISVLNEGVLQVKLIPVTHEYLDDDVKRLMLWREKNMKYFTTSFQVSFESTVFWLNELVLNKDDRILFYISDANERLIGHLELSHINLDTKTCEITNIIRGVTTNEKGLMSHALQGALKWARESLGILSYNLTVLSENLRAINFYYKNDFLPRNCIPVSRHERADKVEYLLTVENESIDKILLVMNHSNKNRNNYSLVYRKDF